MKKNDLIYAASVVHVKELHLLKREDLSELLLADSPEEAFDLLRGHGWGDPTIPEDDAYELLNYETTKVWTLMEELMGNVAPFHVFRHGHDYNNLKAAIKLTYSGYEPTDDVQRYFMPFGLVDIDLLLEAASTYEFGRLPSPMDTVGQEAYEALAHTGSGQNCDVIIDSAALRAIYKAGLDSGNSVLKEYATVTVDSANIKTAIRGNKMRKSKGFFDIAIPDVGSVGATPLKQAAADSEEAVHEFLRGTRYRGGVEELKKSVAAFERWCDNFLMEQIRPARYMISGLEPLAGYVLARENEINMVRLVLSAKANQLDPEIIGERMREMYV